jgi:hypothetical protein
MNKLLIKKNIAVNNINSINQQNNNTICTINKNKYDINYLNNMPNTIIKIKKVNLPNHINQHNNNDLNVKPYISGEYQEKVCIHKYLTKCKLVIQPPGFADYLRGTVALFNLSQKYGYTLLLDNEHPIFKYFENNNKIISSKFLLDNSSISELLPPLSYNDIYNKLNNLFKNNKSFVVMTNSFYNFNQHNMYNWGNISKECCQYLKDILKPSVELTNKIDYIIRNIYNIKNDETFKTIHIRAGDNFIHNNIFDNSLYQKYYIQISNIVNTNNYTKYILISDSSMIANKLKANIPSLYYWDNAKVHIGDLRNNINSALLDTLTDFFILSKSSEIISISKLNELSGFSTVISLIFDIKYTVLNI